MSVDIEFVALAALSAGRSILSIYNKETTIAYKADNSPLTEADDKANTIILEYLSQTPYPIISEEGRNLVTGKLKNNHTYWLVDPLDGTKEFINRNGEFTVNIALIKEGVPILGVVYAPVMQWMYIGVDGEGAWKLELENHKLPSYWKSAGMRLPFQQPDNKSYTIVASRSHASKETDEFISNLEKVHGTLEFISMGSSLKICLVAEGVADIYPRLGPTMEWDTAAGDAIARSAGCKVVQYETGEPLQYNKENLLNPWFIVQR